MSSAVSQASGLVASVVPLVPAWRVDKTFDYRVSEGARERVSIGSLVRVRFGGRHVKAVVVRLGTEPDERGPHDLDELDDLVFPEPLAPPPLHDLVEWIALRYCTTRGKAFARVVPPRTRVEGVGEAGPRARGPSSMPAGYAGVRDLLRAIERGGDGTWLFRTTPGEDHSAVITELTAAALRAPHGAALVAVPEVRYGSLVLDALTSRFGTVARVETGGSERTRARGWLSLAQGHRLGAGGRNTVLAPVPRLRLVVLDEEEHPTFKEDRAPRYDARVVAVERALRSQAVCVLVSATPTVETGWMAGQGSFGLVEPEPGKGRSARPITEVVAVPPERAVSSLLHDRIRSELRRGGRVALLAPAPGYARAVWCSECRRSLRCPSCEGGLAYDLSRRRVRCARCAFEASAPSVCPFCGASAFRFLGAGSERLAEQLGRSFPSARVARMDPGVLADGRAAIAEDADIYVTTWIGTKAVLRPPADLVGVLNADALVRRPDFRSSERAHQALARMAAWAGPAAAGGRLVIQSSDPAHHTIQAVVRGDYRFFLDRELPLRRELGYPPFSELVKVTAHGIDQTRLAARAADAAREASATVLGPIRALRKGAEVRQLLVKCRDALEVALALRGILPTVPAGSRLEVDVDPR